jgi:murein DD-endopeptidase MepM/ murein hydrolase activator NlpD
MLHRYPLKALNKLVSFLVLISFLSACSSRPNRTTGQLATSQSTATDPFDAYMASSFPVADGFDFAVGDANGQGSYIDNSTGKEYHGWYVAVQFAEQYSLGIHTGEDWNGNGRGSTDLGQDVHAVANGRVVFAEHCGRLWGNVIVVEHQYFENEARRKILSLYAHLNEIKVSNGQDVKRRQVIGTIGQDPEKLFSPHLHLELRWDETLAATYWPSSYGKDQAWVSEHYAAPTPFINSHRNIPVPRNEPNLVLVDQESYRARFYQGGVLRNEYDVAFGQGQGQKLVEGDNKTPKGMYFVVEKYRGRFNQPYGEYYGGHWIKINYPNRYDADRALQEELISVEEHRSIGVAWQKKELTPQNTALGGGIGFHGWNKEWANDGPRHLSWGCVVMHLKDIGDFYDQIPKGTMVVIF